jgi:hypothetical protein
MSKPSFVFHSDSSFYGGGLKRRPWMIALMDDEYDEMTRSMTISWEADLWWPEA